jgi:hypothetical protein
MMMGASSWARRAAFSPATKPCRACQTSIKLLFCEWCFAATRVLQEMWHRMMVGASFQHAGQCSAQPPSPAGHTTDLVRRILW